MLFTCYITWITYTGIYGRYKSHNLNEVLLISVLMHYPDETELFLYYWEPKFRKTQERWRSLVIKLDALPSNTYNWPTDPVVNRTVV